MPAVYPARCPTNYLGGHLIGLLPGLVQKHELGIQLDTRYARALTSLCKKGLLSTRIGVAAGLG